MTSTEVLMVLIKLTTQSILLQVAVALCTMGYFQTTSRSSSIAHHHTRSCTTGGVKFCERA